MPYEHLTSVNDVRLAPYARVRDADLAAWPDAPAGLFMAESRTVIAAAIDAGTRPRSFLVSESWADDAAPFACQLLAQHPDCPASDCGCIGNTTLNLPAPPDSRTFSLAVSV